MKITEIFESIQGEGRHAGLPMTFIRFAGCNLRCKYCDTGYAWEGGTENSLDDVTRLCLSKPWKHVQLTGGEPLLQPEIPELCQRLVENRKIVVLETNGTMDISSVPKHVIKIMDIKTPGSGYESKNDPLNIGRLDFKDDVKFVITSREDFDWACERSRALNLFSGGGVLFSAATPMVKPSDLAQWILQAGVPVRFNPQVHRHIWPDQPRGR